MLVGTSHADDAAVFRISDREALVSTIDFFTPVVDDPYRYGLIAAANSLSDVYAMGGEPLFALAVAAFPEDPKVLPLLADVMAGAADKAKEAGICIIGGHTVKDREPKFGLAVTGKVDPGAMWTNRGAKAGDAIVLTKPVGTGVATTAIKWGICPPETAEAAIRSMERLSAGAARVARAAGIHTATDVTGFGLLGHLLEVLEGSGIAAELTRSEIPVFPGIRELMRKKRIGAISARRGIPGASLLHARFGSPPIPGGARENLAFQKGRVRFPPLLPEEEMLLLADPQTSGGLLLFLPEERAEALLAALASEGERGWRIGRTLPHAGPGSPRVVVL
ncbi:MAG: selenide, water dikinase SelD [Deltaproteobacteria bacterium]